MVQRGELRKVGCRVPCEVKCNYYICNEVAPVCPTECVGDISGEATSSVGISKGIDQESSWIDGRQASVARQAAIVIADIKKEQREEREEKHRQNQRERKRADGRSTEERSETTWQQGIARRTVQPSPGVCTCRWTVQESLTSNEDTDEPDAVSTCRRTEQESFACIGETDEPHAVRTRRWTERKRSCVLLKKLTSRMLSVPADGLSGRDLVSYRRNWLAACCQYPPMDWAEEILCVIEKTD